MNTEEIMQLSLELAGLNEIPEDSAIYVPGDNIKTALFGIDAGTAELMLARQLGLDAVIAHHPAGNTAITEFQKVFQRHIPMMIQAGVPAAKAEKAVQKKMADLEIDGHTRNYRHAVDIATKLKMPYLNIHTPLDEIGRKIMDQQIKRKTQENSTVQDVISALNELAEFRNAVTRIKVRVGRPQNIAGKVVVSHAAGTNGGYEIAKTYFEHGVGTVIYIHVGVGDLERLKTEGKGNLIVTGHIASDSVGINPFIQELQKRGVSTTTIGVVTA